MTHSTLYTQGHCQMVLPEGIFCLKEKSMQEVWQQGNFCTKDLISESGLPIKILNKGRTNPNEGPDFKDATIQVGDQTLRGDIELHLYPNLWAAHQHQSNPHFDNVILHVSLFPQALEPQPIAQQTQGSVKHTLILLPYLEESVYEYDHEDDFCQVLDLNSSEQFSHFLFRQAYERYAKKKAQANKRIQRFGFFEAAHQMILEGLGYKRNRQTMANLALQYNARDCHNLSVEDLYTSQQPNWKVCGYMPAGHPKKRLEQYKKLLELNPNWAQESLKFFKSLPPDIDTQANTNDYRKTHKLKDVFNYIRHEIFRNTIPGTRMNTIIYDVLIPLVGSELKQDRCGLWMHGYPGDHPKGILNILEGYNLPRKEYPLSNGLIQGVLDSSDFLED